jgi:hypothetical protein
LGAKAYLNGTTKKDLSKGLFLHSIVSFVEDWLYVLLATSLERVSHPVTLVRIEMINATFIDFSTIELPPLKKLPCFTGLLNG